MKKRYRNFKESYKHSAAITVLTDWLESDFEVKVEPFMGFDLVFRPDIAVYTDGGLRAIYEVVHKHSVDGKKLGKMQYYGYINNVEFLCHEVSVDWILEQTEKPERVVSTFTYEIKQ